MESLVSIYGCDELIGRKTQELDSEPVEFEPRYVSAHLSSSQLMTR